MRKEKIVVNIFQFIFRSLSLCPLSVLSTIFVTVDGDCAYLNITLGNWKSKKSIPVSSSFFLRK